MLYVNPISLILDWSFLDCMQQALGLVVAKSWNS